MIQLSQICKEVNGHFHGDDVSIENVAINTREDCQGRLFVALKGDNFDAHEFVDQAAEAGAAALMVEKAVTTALPSIEVASTHKALTKMAAWWRAQFALPLIGVTGSVGKTTVKEMLSVIFSQFGRGVVTKGNLNNEIGVPLTLMNLKRDDHYAIVEMGMNHAGEIARLTDITRPTIALINNAGAAHLEGLGSVKAVAQAKGEIFQGLGEGGVAIINNDDEFADLWRALASDKKIMTFGLDRGADVTADYCVQDGGLKIAVTAFDQSFEVTLATVGRHNVCNALAAITAALAAGLSVDLIQQGLRNFKPVNGRLNVIDVGGVTVIDDTYNANPASMLAAINVLSDYAENTLIVGDMAELGAAAEDAHRQLGMSAKRMGVDTLYACGDYAGLVVEGYGDGAFSFATQAELLADLERYPPIGTTLVKGSRSAKMENVVAALVSAFETHANGTSVSRGNKSC